MKHVALGLALCFLPLKAHAAPPVPSFDDAPAARSAPEAERQP